MVLGFFYKSINCFKIIIWFFLEDILVTSDNIEETNNSAMDATPTMTDENQDDFLSDANKGDKKSSLKNSYKVLARKYRPQNFEDLMGQEIMVQSLNNAF